MTTWEEYGTRVEARLRTKSVPMESFDVTGRRQLLLDNVAVAWQDGLTRTLHQPVRHAANPVIAPTPEWEGQVAWASVIRDDGGLFRAWYLTEKGLAYATSEDGLRWQKPTVRSGPGGDQNTASEAPNLVLPIRGMDSPTVLRDPLEPDPSRRYKLLAKWSGPPYGMYTGFSADGVRWRLSAQPVLTPANDPGLNDRPTLMQDLARGRFLAFTKREILNPYGRGDWGSMHRARCVSVSADFERWTDPVLVLKPDDQDPPELQIYGQVGFAYESLYLGLLDIFHSGDVGPDERTIDVQLALSRDGETWWRAANRQTFLACGGPQEWDRFIVAPANSQPIEMGNEVWLYYRGRGHARHGGVAEHRRGAPWGVPGHAEDAPLPPHVPPNGIGLARLRRDGFVSLDAHGAPGEMLTRPLLFTRGSGAGCSLRLNADARGGRIRAAVHRVQTVAWKYPGQGWVVGEPVAGMGLEDCLPLDADAVDVPVRWSGRASLEALGGVPVVLRFCLENASLYSFWIG